jgi:hypothetical protein
MKSTKQIFALIIAGYLFLVLGGLSVFHHTCSCNNKISTSIIVENSCCDSHQKHNSCSSNSSNNSCSDSACKECGCKTEVETYAVDETIIVNNSKQVPVRFEYLTLIHTDRNFPEAELAADNTLRLDKFDKSPPDSGKNIVILHQSIKIPFPIS